MDQKMVLRTIAEIKKKRRKAGECAEKYLGTAVIGEILEMIPPNIRLLEVAVGLGGPPFLSPGKYAVAKRNMESGKRVRMDGFVFGDRLTFETVLAGYLIKLNGSPIFGRFGVGKRSYESFEDQEVMRYNAWLELN